MRTTRVEQGHRRSPGRRRARLAVQLALTALVAAAGVLVFGGPAMANTITPDTCLQGYVWREANPSDHVCVTPDVRSQAAYDNSQAAARRSPTGGPYGPDTCLSGYVWRDAFTNDHVCVTPDVRSQAAYDNSQAAARRVGGFIWSDNVVFDGGTPVGGWVSLSVYPNGAYNFSGHFHDSGFTSYDVSVVWVLRTAEGTAFVFTDSGHVQGTLGSGSRDHDWNVSGTNAAIGAAWPSIVAWNNSRWEARTSLDVGGMFNDLKSVVGGVSTVVTVVGAL